MDLGLSYDIRDSKRIKLTARGHAVISAIREIVRDVETEWESRLGAAQFAELRRLLTQLRQITSADV